ncbi:hypothetical protein FZ029_10015 [Azospirillum sp. Sh1]|nr:hypothetical protein FZ029_10015 [Azospirillum sp. Sh1]
MPNARNTETHLPIPPASALDGWKVKNNSAPFSEEAALRYLAQNESQFVERVASIIDNALGNSDCAKKP